MIPLRLVIIPLMLASAACSNRPVPQWLMPTPQLYRDGQVQPFRHLPEHEKAPEVEVFYVTNRKPLPPAYGPAMDKSLRFGVATMRIGDSNETWSSLAQSSTIDPRTGPIEIHLADHTEIARDGMPDAMKIWARRLDGSLRRMDPPDVILYVHGARVGFVHSCALAAELDHFSGRDLTSVAFDWPTHQSIIPYLGGIDLRQAEHSEDRLAETIRILAKETQVRRIHIISWSAGARVVSSAMEQLADGRDIAKARAKYRLGTVVFAASDIPEREFIPRLPAVCGLSDRVLVYLSDNDYALRWASRLMGGGRRLGLAPDKLSDEEKQTLAASPRLEIIDTSYAKEARGFNITGHRYWFQDPWVNSDVILSLRTAAPAAQRGLRAAPQQGVWYFGTDYPSIIGETGRRLTGGAVMPANGSLDSWQRGVSPHSRRQPV